MAHVLSLQVATTGGPVPLHHDLMIRDQVLTVVEMLESPTNPLLDRLATDQFLGEKGRGVGNEDLVEVIPVVPVESPGVTDGEVDDGGPVGEQSGRRDRVEAVEGLGTEADRIDTSIAGHVVTVSRIGQTAPVTKAPAFRPPLGRPVQIAYAVDPRSDLGETADRFRSVTGSGPFLLARNIELSECSVRGRPASFDHSSAYGWWGETMVELIQEHTAPIIDRTAGVHHVAFMVDDLETARDWCETRAWPTLLDARVRSGTRFVFVDARDELGHLVEMYERSEALVSFYERVRALADDVRT